MSTMNMQMESFYAAAKDADILIYNSTIDGELQTMDQLLQKSDLAEKFQGCAGGARVVHREESVPGEPWGWAT